MKQNTFSYRQNSIKGVNFMRKTFIILLSLTLIFSFAACSASPPAVDSITIDTEDAIIAQDETLEEKLSGFDFSIKYGVMGISSIDTFSNTVTKDLVSDGVATANIVLSIEVKNRAYDDFLAMDILSFPDTIVSEPGHMWIPYETYEITVKIDGVTKHIDWKHDGNPDYEKAENLLSLIKYLAQYVQKLDEYKALPTPNGGYD